MLEDWRGKSDVTPIRGLQETVDGMLLVKRERLPDGRIKLILQDQTSGAITQRFVEDDG